MYLAHLNTSTEVREVAPHSNPVRGPYALSRRWLRVPRDHRREEVGLSSNPPDTVLTRCRAAVS